MDLGKILSKYIVKNDEFIFDDKSYQYTKATYQYKENQYAKYYILDFVNEPTYYQIKWDDMNVFQEFQAKLLEDDFFRCYGDARYNIYLVFLVDNNSMMLYNMGIQADFKYARKVILAESEADIFFNESFALKRNHLASGLENTDPQKIMEQLYISKEKARKSFETEIEILNRLCVFDNKYFKKSISSFRELLFCIGDLEGKMPERKRQKKGIIGRTKQDILECDIKAISSIGINQFRKYKGEYEIPFRRVNLFYGENGAGKTSLLEAIEYGITGCNRSGKKEKATEGSINIKCIRNQNESFIFSLEKEYYNLAKSWYGIKVSNCEEFNRFFTQYNYFDTSWASAFAIEGKESVNINQLKNYLNLENMENCQKILHEFYERLREITTEREKDIDRLKRGNIIGINSSKLIWRIRKKNQIYNPIAYLSKIETYNHEIQTECKKELKMLTEKLEIVTLESMLLTHINKMKRIFKLLVCSNEYCDLQLLNGEIVAIRCGTKESVSMSEMSTGQKVCLALSFMFSLFLSNENAPNVIMLDEPVANLDDIHMLNLLDVLRRFAMAGTQIFFTTSNPNVAKLFRRKFSYLEEEFGFYRISEAEDKVKITYEQYTINQENPVIIKNL